MDSNSLPTITTPRLVMRWASEDDVDALYEIFSDPRVMRYWSSGPLPNREAAAAMQREIAQQNLNDAQMKWGLALRDTNNLIGTVTLFNLSISNGRAEIGYAMGSAYWGKGYMNEALKELIIHALDAMNFRRLEADVAPCNDASLRTLKRLGFQRE